MKNKTAETAKKQEISNTPVSKDNSSAFHNEPFNPVKGEMALWTAVITQALMDAGSESRKPEAQHEKARAIRWLLGNSEDFITVCQNAGLSPQYVRSKAKSAIERGCAWRRGMAEQRAIAVRSVSTPIKAAPPPYLLERKYCTPPYLKKRAPFVQLAARFPALSTSSLHPSHYSPVAGSHFASANYARLAN